ncbi:MAG: hypothetical protein KatS3mg082_2502 [Nitrospiraceae bacterium]|nr:MAG: hypothetical protein KatS3mg082_2502 [Nitrospiraceae bacterium]
MIDILLLGRKPLPCWQRRAFDHACTLRQPTIILSMECMTTAANRFFDGVHRFLPGQLLELSLKERSELWTCWLPRELPPERRNVSLQEAAAECRERFLWNVQLHMRSDVPIGVALSGGLDSSAIACAVRHLLPRAEIHTFTYRPQDRTISEDRWADIVARAIDAHVHTVRFCPQELEAAVDDIVARQGEPFGSTSVVAQYFVAREAKRAGMKVLLEGQGGDEILAGYDGYPAEWLQQVWHRGDLSDVVRMVRSWPKGPGRSRLRLAWLLARRWLPQAARMTVERAAGKPWNPPWMNARWLADHDVLPVWPAGSRETCRSRVFHWALRQAQTGSLQHLLRHGDRNAMAFSIENRTPFLTLEFSDFVLSLPPQFLVGPDGTTKRLLREALRGLVPDAILDRRDKVGFRTDPDDTLLSSPRLRKRAASVIRELPLFNTPAALRLLSADTPKAAVPWHSNMDWQRWRLINLALWCERFGVN